MRMSNNHSVIILAGGLSRRLGRPKQLLSKEGQPLIGYMIKQAIETQPQKVIVVVPDNNLAIKTAINNWVFKNSDVIIINNLTPETGMAHSISLGISALTKINVGNTEHSVHSRVLIMGVDQVLLDSLHLIKLLADKQTVVASSYAPLFYDKDRFCIDKSKANIVGLPINISYLQLKQWQAALNGDKGLRHLIRSLSDEQMSTVINHKLSYDVDTPEQFAYARQQRWLDNNDLI